MAITMFGLHSTTAKVGSPIKLAVEYRARFERRIDRDFTESVNDNRGDLHERIRIGGSWKASPEWTLYAQYQYAHSLGWSQRKNGSDESSDLAVLNAQYKEGETVATVGRQRINLGSERLVGSLEWINVGRTYDGFRVKSGRLDAFAARLAIQRPLPKDVRLVGLSMSSKPGTASLIYKHDEPTAGHVDIYTVAVSGVKKCSAVTFEGEAAVQWGQVASRDQEAWAYHLAASKGLTPKLRGTLELNAASGGSTSTKVRTFDNLYPTNHKFYGVMDLHAWKNMNQVLATISSTPRPDLELKARVGKSWLRDPSDAWYGASGAPNRRPGGNFVDPTGNSGRDLGWEIDLEAILTRKGGHVWSLGFGHFVPGNFVKNVSGDNRPQNFGYVQYSAKF